MASQIKSSRARGALLDIHQAAEYLGVTERWLRRQLSEKRIPYLKLGPGRSSPLRFDTGDLEAWLIEHRHESGIA